jgi:hypothetical protein
MDPEIGTLPERTRRLSASGAEAPHSEAVRRALLRDRSANIGGLCGNCVHLETCTYPKAISDTWFCEEYECESAEALALPEAPLVVLNGDIDERLGLCTNCELRESCTFPKPAGGVWFCGEYQ